MGAREENLLAAEQEIFDVAILGGGINGACLFDQLRRAGYQAILLDKGDFGSGTSQASAMMIWGGLLYLAGFDFRTVFSLSQARDRMIRDMPEWVAPRNFGILPASRGLLGKRSILLALKLYRLLGGFHRSRATIKTDFPEQPLLRRELDALLYEEGFLRHSDARFVLSWIIEHRPPSGAALNHMEAIGGTYRNTEKLWHLMARDAIGPKEITIRTRSIANCAGIWTDQINATFGIRSPVKHIFSKGVFLGLHRKNTQETPLIFDTGEHSDVICSVPWGPIELWGPTETRVAELKSGFDVSTDDIHTLLDQRARHYKEAISKDDIVSFRAGSRPLAVQASYDGDDYPLSLSRGSRIVVDSDRPWISVYGGKITNCQNVAKLSVKRLAPLVPPPLHTAQANPSRQADNMSTSKFPGLDAVFPSIDWCMKHEFCCTIDDYLRRRTNIAQWVPREGLGLKNEHRQSLHALCLQLNDGNRTAAEQQLAAYEAGVVERFDRLLKAV